MVFGTIRRKLDDLSKGESGERLLTDAFKRADAGGGDYGERLPKLL